MKFQKNIILKSVYALIAVLAIIASTGCSSFDNEMFENYYNIAEEINVNYNERFEVLSLKNDDTSVIPVVFNELRYDIEDHKVVKLVKGKYLDDDYFIAVGPGSTTIKILTEDGDLVRSIRVNVTLGLDFTFPERIDVKYGDEFNLSGMIGGELESLPDGIYYTSANENIVKVNAGSLRGVGIGSTTIDIFCNASGYSAHLLQSIPVSVEINGTITLKPGETCDVSTIVPGRNVTGMNSKDTSIALADAGGLALGCRPGHTVVYNDDVWIEVNVESPAVTDLFNVSFNDLDRHVYLSGINYFMKNYTCTYEGNGEYGGQTYYIKEYKPFDKAVSVTYYLSTSWDHTLKFAIIDTGMSSSDVLGWLFNNDEYYSRGNPFDGTLRFETRNAWTYYIKPLDGSWSKMSIGGAW